MWQEGSRDLISSLVELKIEMITVVVPVRYCLCMFSCAGNWNFYTDIFKHFFLMMSFPISEWLCSLFEINIKFLCLRISREFWPLPFHTPPLKQKQVTKGESNSTILESRWRMVWCLGVCFSLAMCTPRFITPASNVSPFLNNVPCPLWRQFPFIPAVRSSYSSSIRAFGQSQSVRLPQNGLAWLE